MKIEIMPAVTRVTGYLRAGLRDLLGTLLIAVGGVGIYMAGSHHPVSWGWAFFGWTVLFLGRVALGFHPRGK
jgi:hypothetical protein